MPENIKIGIIGGDRRSLVCAENLSKNYECAVWGFDTTNEGTENHLINSVKCTDWESAVKCSDAVILPLPASHDGVNLACPLSSATPVKLENIVRALKTGSVLMGGRIPVPTKRLCAELGVTCYDYYDSEEVQIKNSVPTAEGAISSCITSLPITVHGMRAAVVGYGRIGRTLAQKLVLLGASVFAVARSVRDLSWAKCDGCIPTPLDSFVSAPIPCDAIFNTVPYPLFDRDVLKRLTRECVIFELASGVDTEAAAELGIRLIPLPSLPGKTSPQTAGEIIYSAIFDKLKQFFEGDN